MKSQPIRFNDGGAYDRFMGVWSRLVGPIFLDWLAAAPHKRWLDVGCGNGAFTQMIVERTQPRSIHGIDPSEAQLEFARQQPALDAVNFQLANAMDLPFADDEFDCAVMPLVLFFVPDPARGVAEMARVVGPGGLVAAYSWDMTAGGFPYQQVRDALGEFGIAALDPPSAEASRQEVLRALWLNAGLTAIESQTITVERTYLDFEDYWNILLAGPSVAQAIAALDPGGSSRLRELLQSRLQPSGGGPITLSARANAIRGVVPAGDLL